MADRDISVNFLTLFVTYKMLYVYTGNKKISGIFVNLNYANYLANILQDIY